MSLTKPLNSKVNMKQVSGADLPVIPRQPALARYTAESTSSQTVITFPFQIDTVNGADSFILTVDGKLMTPGATNDYQFSGIDSFGFSNSVTMNFPLSAGLNIQAIKLGLKKETEFVQDARFSALYESMDQGLQGFIRTADVMVATSTAGTPNAGQFYSSITNRASLPDFAKDLRVRMGNERIVTNALVALPAEFGPANQYVGTLPNDDRVRFVGSSWTSSLGSGGQWVYGNGNQDYFEVTFYGTGLNLLGNWSGGNKNLVVSVDGGAFGSNIVQTISGVLDARNYNNNMIINAAANLPLGVHTVTVRINAAATDCPLAGIEILNESTSLKVNPGSSYLAGKKATTIAQQTVAHNATFESGTLGSRGGRVVVYQKADGTIGKAVQPVDASQLNLTSADHTNEEVARVYHWREFGAGRADDHSIFTAVGHRFFTLDDGTTNLSTQNASVFTNNTLSVNSSGDFIQFTFVGTGLDILEDAVNRKQYKIVSGLPYGTHVVRFVASVSSWAVSVDGTSLGTFVSTALGIKNFIVYQPKKPSIPSGAVELADYNVMATFAANATSGAQRISTGVLRKHALREFVYVGAGWLYTLNGDFTNLIDGYTVESGANANSYAEYVFYGTGFDLRGLGGNGSGQPTSVQMSLQSLSTSGSLVNLTTGNFPSISTSVYGGWTFTAGTGILNMQGVVGTFNGSGLVVSGLPLGEYKVRIQTTVATDMRIEKLDIITPIHSYESNLPFDLQNTLTVGSQGISDNRKTTPVKEALVPIKNSAYAAGVTSNPTTTSTSNVPVPDLSLSLKTSGGRVEINYSLYCQQSTTAQTNSFQIYVNGAAASGFRIFQAYTNGAVGTVSDSIIITLPAGVHKIDVYWAVGGGTGTLLGTTSRGLSAKEL